MLSPFTYSGAYLTSFVLTKSCTLYQFQGESKKVRRTRISSQNHVNTRLREVMSLNSSTEWPPLGEWQSDLDKTWHE